jgi:uncharacterized membrane protein
MPHPLSTLGIIHTAISLVPVVTGIVSFARYRGIRPDTRVGQTYLAFLALSVFTSFGLSSTGGFNPGHALGILALIAAFGGMTVVRLAPFGRARPYLGVVGLSTSFFLLLVPGINESLTRLPPAHPIAVGPQSVSVQSTLAVWFAIVVIAIVMQCRGIAVRNRTAGAT